MRQPIPLPKIDESETTKRKWLRSLDIIDRLPECPLPVGRERSFALWLKPNHLDEISTVTRDELSEFLSAPIKDIDNFQARVDQEGIIQQLLNNAYPSLTESELECVAGQVIGTARQSPRTGRHFSVPDKNNRRVEFIPPEKIASALRGICQVWNESTHGYEAIQRFLWLIVAVSNVHAFRDGNGRLARALANAYLLKVGMLRHGPLPMGPLIYATTGNFELAVRRAEITHDWEPLSKVFLSIIELYARYYHDFNAETARGNGHE